MSGDVPVVTGPHWTVCDGGSDANRAYCLKEDSAERDVGGSKSYTFEFGELRGIRGRRASDGPGRVVGGGGGRGGARAALAEALQGAARGGHSFNSLVGDHVHALLSCGRTAEVVMGIYGVIL